MPLSDFERARHYKLWRKNAKNGLKLLTFGNRFQKLPEALTLKLFSLRDLDNVKELNTVHGF